MLVYEKIFKVFQSFFWHTVTLDNFPLIPGVSILRICFARFSTMVGQSIVDRSNLDKNQIRKYHECNYRR